jgi:hypothetical protein
MRPKEDKTNPNSELGFVIDDAACPKDYSRRKEPLPRDALIVLEYDGGAYQSPRYKVEVAYGRRLEHWIRRVDAGSGVGSMK